MFKISILSFLESPDTEAAMDFGASEVMESEVLYDCVICGQSGPSTEDRPFGLVVLLQASSGTSCTYTLFQRCWIKTNVYLFCVFIDSSSSWHIWFTILKMTCLFGWLAIILIGSLIIMVISLHGCIPITLEGNLSWKLTVGVAEIE